MFSCDSICNVGRLSWRWGVAASVVCAAWACSQADPHPPLIGDTPPHDSGIIITPTSDSSTPKDGGTNEASSTCPTDDAGCNTLPNCGTQVFVNQIPQGPPVASGGSVIAGTYRLTTYDSFTGTTGGSGVTTAWFRETMTLTASADGGAQSFDWQDVSETNTNQIQVSTNGEAVFTNTAAVFTASCPGANVVMFDYSASSTTLILEIAEGTSTSELIYTKQ
jgi:hypothetical protein